MSPKATFYFVADDGSDPIEFTQEASMKALLARVGKALAAVIHDPEVQRSGKQFAAKIAVRLALAAGGGAFWVGLIHKYLG